MFGFADVFVYLFCCSRHPPPLPPWRYCISLTLRKICFAAAAAAMSKNDVDDYDDDDADADADDDDDRDDAYDDDDDYIVQ